MNTAITADKEKQFDIMEAVIAKGDLAQLTPNERGKYYVRVCESLELNPMSRPFIYVTLNGRLTLYPTEVCAAQLRSKYGVSIVSMTTEEREDGIYIATVKVVDKDGRTDTSIGAVNIAGLRGEALANAMMKAETKAKRRVSLSLCGLGHQDETDDPAAASSVPPSPPQNRPRLADQLDALAPAQHQEIEKRPRRGRPKKNSDDFDDAEIEQSQERLAALLDEPEPQDDDLKQIEGDVPDDGWPGPVRHDYEQGKRDAIAGHGGCLNRDIRDIATRYAEWQKGYDSIKKRK